jgi:hypothetical protein
MILEYSTNISRKLFDLDLRRANGSKGRRSPSACVQFKAPTQRRDTIRDDIALWTKTAVYRVGCAHRRDTREPFSSFRSWGTNILTPQFLSWEVHVMNPKIGTHIATT